MEIMNCCAHSSATVICTIESFRSINKSKYLHTLCKSRDHLLLSRRSNEWSYYQHTRVSPSFLRSRAQDPFSNSNNDDQCSPDVSSSSDLEPPKLEVKRVETAYMNGPSKLRYGLLTGLAGVGLVETAYLTWMKLNGGPVSCPLGGTSCNDVLNSEYGTVFGVPLSLVGVAAYGVVTLLAGRMVTNTKERASKEEEFIRWLLLASTTAMAVASSYFIYILNVKLDGASCSYCYGSALLSVSLLLSTLPFGHMQSFSIKDLRNVAGIQVAVGSAVAVVLSVAFSNTGPAIARSGDIDLPPIEPEVSTMSTSKEITLAKQLKAIGAKMYGAFWCSHCFEQKQMFGKEAMKDVDYVECYPEGYRRGVQIAKECDAANIQGFPTWIINGQQYSGEQDFAKLAELSGLESSKLTE